MGKYGTSLLQKIWRTISAHIQYDHHWIIIILAFALLTRLPFIAHPGLTKFDEVIYVNFTLHTLNHLPFFSIHPPFIQMLFAESVRWLGPFSTFELSMISSRPFGDFPLITLRYLLAIVGSMLPVLVYLIARILKCTPRIAALPALFVVFDGAFILYSRTALPDTILLFLNFFAVGDAFLMLRVKDKKISTLLLVVLSVAMGCAISIKWLALAVLGTIWFLFLWERKYVAIITSGLIALGVYLTIFTLFILYFPYGGPMDYKLIPSDARPQEEIEFPSNASIFGALQFLPKLHERMLRVSKDTDVSNEYLFPAPGPLSWATSHSSIYFWADENAKFIIFKGNTLLWSFSFFLFAFHVAWILWHIKHKLRWPLGRDETILFVGYIFNYVPFFFIHRPMYLYHYFTALIFLFLMIPKILPRMIDCVATIIKDRGLALALVCLLFLLIFLNFIFSIPTIYGF